MNGKNFTRQEIFTKGFGESPQDFSGRTGDAIKAASLARHSVGFDHRISFIRDGFGSVGKRFRGSSNPKMIDLEVEAASEMTK